MVYLLKIDGLPIEIDNITRWYHLAWDHIKAWMYLQPIFDSPDIMKQLPTEGKKFKVVDGREGPGKS